MANFLGNAIPLWNRLFPKGESGPRGLNYTFQLSTAQSISLNVQLGQNGMDFINGVFIDNSANNVAFTLYNPVTLQRVFIPANSQGRVSLLTTKSGDNINFVGSSTGGVDVPVMFTNIEPLSDNIWSVLAPGSVSGAVTVIGQVTVAPLATSGVTRSAAIAAGGTSQLLMPANATRKRFIIQNPFSAAGEGIASAETAYFNFGAAAGIDNGTSFELLAGASYDSATGPVYNGAININAATTGHRLIAWEY